MKHVSILGSTGSIGKNTLAVIAMHPQHFSVFALSANRNVDQLLKQCQLYHPKYAVMVDAKAADELIIKIKEAKLKTTVLAGKDALLHVASADEVDIVVAAIVGAAGLLPTLAAIKADKKVLLANKEALVMSGELMSAAVRESNGVLLPVDSEHNAILQCFPDDFKACHDKPEGVTSVTLTASGGPFRHKALSALENVTPAQAIAHPNWSMGPKISVDSATMVNKSLEVIEAHWLFGLNAEQINVVIHPQSIVHSVVNYLDGSLLAHLGEPDMRVPIANALAWPQQLISGVKNLDLTEISKLEFEPVDTERFPALTLAYAALRAGGSAACILNAANEIAVAAFLTDYIRFTDIVKIIDSVLEKMSPVAVDNIETILAIDAQARCVAEEMVIQYCHKIEII